MKKYFILFLIIVSAFCFLTTNVFAVKIIYPKNSLSSPVPETIRPQVYDSPESVPIQQKISDDYFKNQPGQEVLQNSQLAENKKTKNNFLYLALILIILATLIFVFKKWYNKFVNTNKND
jgi:hypothetical protein